MKYYRLVFMFLCSFSKLFGQSYNDTNFLNPEKPSVIYYNFYNGIQIIEVDTVAFSIAKFAAKLRRVNADPWILPFQGPNPYILRNMKGDIVAQFNTRGKKYLASNFLPVDEVLGKTKAHKRSDILNLQKDYNSGNSSKCYPFYGDHTYLIFAKWAHFSKRGLMDTFGNIILEPKYDNVYLMGSNYYVSLNGQWGLLNSKCETIITPQYKLLSYERKNTIMAEDSNGKSGFIDNMGKIICPFIYDDIDYVFKFNGYYIFKLNEKYGFMDTAFKIICPAKYGSIKPFEKGFYVGNDGPKAIVNKKGVQITEFLYNQGPELMPSGYYRVSKIDYTKKQPEVFGFLDSFGREVGKIKYQMADDFYDGLGLVQLNYKRGFINSRGKVVIPFKYDDAYSLRNGYIIVHIGKLFGMINYKGKEIIPLLYNSIEYSGKDIITCIKDGNVFLYNEKGELIKKD